jgi:AraC-like DNA-binding protein
MDVLSEALRGVSANGRSLLQCRAQRAVEFRFSPSWLAAARDATVGRALAQIHRDPSRGWTLATLAKEAGVSRTILTERFTRLLGEPPFTYLARWRLHLAARLLTTTDDSVLQIGLAVGYESEAAFNRAFKREFNLPPARYRRSRTTS